MMILRTVLCAGLQVVFFGVGLGGTFYGLYQLATAYHQGALTTWQWVGTPPERAVRLWADGPYPEDEFCAETVLGHFYCFNRRPEFAPSLFWRPEPAPGRIGDDRSRSEAPCEFSVSAPPLAIVDRVDYEICYEFTSAQTAYAMLADGSFWQWQHAGGFLSAILLGLGLQVVAPILAPLVGLGLADLAGKICEVVWPRQRA